MDYGMLTPEINSARMYSGAGSGPLLAAAAAWDALAAELHSAAASYGSVVSGLTSQWSGPSSASMAAAATPYTAWMTTAATQAQQAATQAKAAAGAYEAAFAMTVPPPVVAANRSLLASLMATNVLGQNTPAIAATEAHYGEMWAQDAAAMYGYAGASAAATKVTPFTPPTQTINPAGLSGQSAAVAQATGTSAATNAQATVSQVTSAVPSALQQLASPAASTSTTAAVSPLATLASGVGLQPGDITNGLTNLSSSTLSPMSLAGITQVGSDLAVIRSLGGVNGLGAGGLGAAGIAPITTGVSVGTLGPVGSAAWGGSAVSAGLGQATTVGTLSVPQSWAAATPAVSSAATALPGTSFSAIPANGAAGMPGMPMGGMGGMGGRFGGTGPRYGFKPIVMARPPAAGYGPIAL